MVDELRPKSSLKVLIAALYPQLFAHDFPCCALFCVCRVFPSVFASSIFPTVDPARYKLSMLYDGTYIYIQPQTFVLSGSLKRL